MNSQGGTLDHRHDVVENPVNFAGIKQLEDVRVVETGSDADFPNEAHSTHRCGQLRPERLDGDSPAMLQIFRLEDNGHPTATDFTIDPVTRC
jgi:hypothetical protein